MSVIDAMGGPSNTYANKSRPQKKVGSADFDLLRVIGQGGYGKVRDIQLCTALTKIKID